MGLDNIWMKNKDEHGVIEGEFKICGGVFSGHGNDSFRGKVYERFVEDVTGVSLFVTRKHFKLQTKLLSRWQMI